MKTLDEAECGWVSSAWICDKPHGHAGQCRFVVREKISAQGAMLLTFAEVTQLADALRGAAATLEGIGGHRRRA